MSITLSFGIELINFTNSLVIFGVFSSFTNPTACKVCTWSLSTIKAAFPLALLFYNLPLIVNSIPLKNEPYFTISFKSTYLVVPFVVDSRRGFTPK